jgi:hypothetical protein
MPEPKLEDLETRLRNMEDTLTYMLVALQEWADSLYGDDVVEEVKDGEA